MDNTNIINDRQQKLNELKLLLNDVDVKLLNLIKELNWDHKKLLEENVSDMGTCSINQQHRVPVAKLKIHEEKCSWRSQGYSDGDKVFPEYSGTGSSVTLTEEILLSITNNVPSYPVLLYAFIMMEITSNHYDQIALIQVKKKGNKDLRRIPQTSANLDQNFSREEKLAIYDYVIEHTQKQISYSDLWLQPEVKSEEKKEMTAWEIAAAERDAKRRRASYRNKVHTNRKTHTEILREVIEAQMEVFKEENASEKQEEMKNPKTGFKKSSHESWEKSRHEESSSRGNKEDRDKRRNHDKHSKHRDHKRYPSNTGSDIKSRSRLDDKYRKWKSYEGRSHSHRSSHTRKRR